MADMPKPTLITVALCTHNHADRLQRTLNDIGRLDSPARPWEIIVVDNASSDNTPQMLADPGWHPPGVPVRVVREMRLGLSNARNRAIKEASGEYLLFVDDDETPDPQWLVAYEREMLTHAPDALGGRIEVFFEGGDRPAWLQDEILGFLGQLNHGDARWLNEPDTPFYGGNFTIHRKLFTTVGEFDPELGRKGRINSGGEDTEYYQRLLAGGYRVRWVPDAIIHHRIRTDKLRRSYFLELHYRQGRMEGVHKRGNSSRFPPKYLLPQLGRAIGQALIQRWKQGNEHSLRQEMNAVYFLGYIQGWAFAGNEQE